MDEAAVREFVDRSQEIIDASPQMDEENTKVKLVQPFIELLGWDIYSTEVELEYPIQMGVGTKKVDYALLVDGAPKLLVEAKGLDTGLGDGATTQLKSYLRQELAAEWGIVTDGEQYRIFRKSDQNNEELAIGTFTLDDLRADPDILDLVAKESITSGRADDIVARLRETRTAIATLQREKDSLADDITNTVADSIGEVRTLSLETESKEFIDSLVGKLEREEREITRRSPREEESSGNAESAKTPKSTEQPEQRPTTDGESAIAGTIRRSDLNGPDDALLAVFPTQKSGIEFLKDNNAWGFVRIGQKPDYVAMYVGDGESEIRYVAAVDHIVKTEAADLAKPAEEYTDQAKFDPDKRVIVFKPGTLYELEDPVPFESRYPQALRYSTLGELRNAETTDDML